MIALKTAAKYKMATVYTAAYITCYAWCKPLDVSVIICETNERLKSKNEQLTCQ